MKDLELALEELREENARLRADQQRPLDPYALAAQLDDANRAMALESAPDGDDGAEQRQALLDIAVTREGLLEVCTRLQALAGQVHRQLSAGTPPAEIDRRVTQVRVPHDRRRYPGGLDVGNGVHEIVTTTNGKQPATTGHRNGTRPAPGGGSR